MHALLERLFVSSEIVVHPVSAGDEFNPVDIRKAGIIPKREFSGRVFADPP
jgi:hypothetical protein